MARDPRSVNWRRAVTDDGIAPLLSLLVALVLALAIIVEPAPVTTLRNTVFDTWQRLGPRPYVPAAVRVVAIDEDSLAREGQWPWPRTRIAQLVARLQEMGAAAIALDMVFAEPDRTSPAAVLADWPEAAGLAARLPDNDQTLAATIGRGRVVLGYTLLERDDGTGAPSRPYRVVVAGDDPLPFLAPGYRGASPNLPVLEAAGAGAGTITYPPDTDGVVRRVPLFLRWRDQAVPTLAAEALRVALDQTNYVITAEGRPGTGRGDGIRQVRIGPLVLPTDAAGRVWLHYSRPAPDRLLPAWKVLAGQVPAEAVADSVVFVGVTARGLLDLRLTPLGGVAPGVEANAQLVEQAVAETLLVRPPLAGPLETVVVPAFWLLLVVAFRKTGALPPALATALFIAAAFGASWHLFSAQRLLLDPLNPSIGMAAVFLAWSVPRALAAENRARWIRGAFASYVSPNLVRHLMDHPESLRLGGEMRECSFVMTDLAGFTTLMEQYEPERVVALLNAYLDRMVAIAFRHQGTLDRFVGDAVAVMFSAPLTQPDHAARAVACALDMDVFAQDFAAARQAEGVPFGLTRIGVHGGPVLVGNFGGGTIFDYRALGDPVNTASRLEALNKHLGTRVCVSAATAQATPGFAGRPVGRFLLKGKHEPIAAFEPSTGDHAAWSRAYALLDAADPAAQAALAALDGDPVAQFHLARLRRGESGATVVMIEK